MAIRICDTGNGSNAENGRQAYWRGTSGQMGNLKYSGGGTDYYPPGYRVYGWRRTA